MSKNYPVKDNVEVFFEYLPDYQDLNFDASRFPIFKFDEALEYAKQLEVTLKTKYKDMADMPVQLTAPISNLELFDFDQEEDELFKFCFVLASNIVRRSVQHNFHQIHSDSPPLFEGERFDTFQKIKDELYATNMLLEEKGDLCHMATDIVELWQSLRKPTYDNLGRPSKGFKIMHEKVADLIDDQVISIGNSIPMKF